MMKKKAAGIAAALAVSAAMTLGASAQGAAGDIINGAEDIIDGAGDAIGDAVDGVGDAADDILGGGSTPDGDENENDTPDEDEAGDAETPDDNLTEDTDEDDIEDEDELEEDVETDEEDDEDDAVLGDENPSTSSSLWTATMIAAGAAGVAYLTKKRNGHTGEATSKTE